MDIAEEFGWLGILAILVAYSGNSLGFFTAQMPAYQALNLLGAAALIIDTRKKKDWPLFSLNITWALIAVYSLARAYF